MTVAPERRFRWNLPPRWRRRLQDLAAVAGILAAAVTVLAFLGFGLPLPGTSPGIGPAPSPVPSVSQPPRPARPKTIPAVVGLSEAHAAARLRGAGFAVTVHFSPATTGSQVGLVLGQGPAAGVPSGSGTTVVIVVGTAGGSDRPAP
jgi:hypothetical protein